MRTPMELLVAGWRALVKELGLADALRYKVLFEPGKGDYPREREELFEGMSLADWERELRLWQARDRSSQQSPPDRLT
jgi:hypothetical protein